MDVKGGKILRKWLGKTNIDRWQFYMQHITAAALTYVRRDADKSLEVRQKPELVDLVRLKRLRIFRNDGALYDTSDVHDLKGQAATTITSKKTKGSLRDFENTCTVHHC